MLLVYLEFYAKTKKRLTVIRNNRKCLIENIDPSDELIASLLSLNCITEKQSHVIKRQHSKRMKNAELLYVVRTFNDAKFAKLVNILRQTNQMAAARIVDDGGGSHNKFDLKINIFLFVITIMVILDVHL